MKRILVCLLLAAALAAPSLALASGGAPVRLRTTMTGRKAVPRGARRGRGSATVRIAGRRVCILQLGRRYRASGCATTTVGTAQQLGLSPRGYYVTVNTRRFPLGAVRGQLRRG